MADTDKLTTKKEPATIVGQEGVHKDSPQETRTEEPVRVRIKKPEPELAPRGVGGQYISLGGGRRVRAT